MALRLHKACILEKNCMLFYGSEYVRQLNIMYMINVAIELSNSYLPVLVHYGVLVHEGSVVTVEGGIMHKPKASIICLSALTKLHNAQ